MDVKQQVRHGAIRLLARREHSQAELVQKLKGLGPSSLVLEVLGELEQEGLQSDYRTMQMLLRSRLERGQGPLKLRQSAMQKGISGEVVNLVLEEEAPDWEGAACDVWRRRFGRAPSTPQERAKQLRFLCSRGFSPGQAQAALRGAATDE